MTQAQTIENPVYLPDENWFTAPTNPGCWLAFDKSTGQVGFDGKCICIGPTEIASQAFLPAKYSFSHYLWQEQKLPDPPKKLQWVKPTLFPCHSNNSTAHARLLTGTRELSIVSFFEDGSSQIIGTYDLEKWIEDGWIFPGLEEINAIIDGKQDIVQPS
jgi:hypothetical protein